ncbi:MAG: metal-sulfur cluster assembly factor [Herpetosiphonaceae bacterium]|nr:metal-sulfur cluster assembly factor [Herpetosiphonaceae bacterium]
MVNEDMIRAALKNVVDPEIGLNVVDLGLIYGVDVANEGKSININMTLTTPACPAGPEIISQAKQEVTSLRSVYPEIEDIKINLVWTPFWNPSLMSEDAKAELGYF